ncbi:hypothetical protein E2P81_ATG04774 [Venturia nashicola]|nr:hypothetical protein E2P81_ATG04774 [Venturia nashicola]
MGRPRKRRREDDDLENIALGPFELFPFTAGFHLPGTDLLHDFEGGNQASNLPFLSSSDLSFGTQLDPGLSTFDPMLDQPLTHSTHHHESGPCNSVCQDTREAVFFEGNSNMHARDANNSGNHTSFQVASLPLFSTPSSSRNHSTPPTQCACLTSMTETLSSLRSINPYSFPESLAPIRNALRASHSLLNCTICPQESTTAMQNIMFLATLLTSITDAYRALLTSIDSEAARALSTGEKKQFRIGDSDPQKAHLHTGTADCPMGFNIALSGSEWKMLTRKVVEGDIFVPASPLLESHQASQNEVTVLGLVKQLEERQLRWHENCEHEHLAGTEGERCVPKEGEEFHCLRVVKMVRIHVDTLDLGGGE